MPQKDIRTFVLPLCRKLAEEMHFELIDAELVKEGPGRYLRVYIDKESGITLDDCEKYHRAIQPKLEPVDYDFLEISSPGMDRPLKMDRDYERALGSTVEVKLYKPIDGAKAYQGTLTGYTGETLTITSQAGERMIDRRDAALVKPVIIFEDDEGETLP